MLVTDYSQGNAYRDTYTSGGNKKPFNRGEHNYWEYVDHDQNGSVDYDAAMIFDNYDVSYHNEVWATAFFGNFTTGNTWQWQRVFWWPASLPQEFPLIPWAWWIPPDYDNQFEQSHTGGLGDWNTLDIGQGTTHIQKDVQNRTVQHHFKPLYALLNNPDWLDYHFFDGAYEAYESHDSGDRIECYYLMNDAQDLAIGWIHNMNAYWEHKYYATHNVHDFLGCAAANADQHVLSGFAPGDYHITWFPTHMNTSVRPDDYEYTSVSGEVPLDLSTAPFQGVTADNYIDTLHTDYAFIISTGPVVRSPEALSAAQFSEWDFTLYPNPANAEWYLRLPDDAPKQIVLEDLSGREVRSWSNLAGPELRLPTGPLAKGAYCVRVSDGHRTRTKQLIIH